MRTLPTTTILTTDQYNINPNRKYAYSQYALTAGTNQAGEKSGCSGLHQLCTHIQWNT